MLASARLFCALASIATSQLEPLPAFIPAYASALVLSDLITAVLLFGQFNFPRPLQVLGCGYLFTAVIALVHMLTLPNVFSTSGLVGLVRKVPRGSICCGTQAARFSSLFIKCLRQAAWNAFGKK